MSGPISSDKPLTLRENALIAINGGIPDWVPNWFTCASVVLPMAFEPGERPERGGVDFFGVEWEFVPVAGAPMIKPGTKRLKDITKWKEELIFPDLEIYDWEAAAAKDMAGVNRVEQIPLIIDLNGIFERSHALMGFEDILVAMLEEPEVCYELFGAIADHKIRLHKKYAEYYKPEWIEYHDDWGNSKNLFFPPRVFRELLKPHTQRIVENLLSLDIIPQLHSHGKIVDIMDDVVEMGFKVVDPIEPVNDVQAVKD